MPAVLAKRAAVTVERLDAGPALGRAELQSTREAMLTSILQTPTVWLDFDATTSPNCPPAAGSTRIEGRSPARRGKAALPSRHRTPRRSTLRD